MLTVRSAAFTTPAVSTKRPSSFPVYFTVNVCPFELPAATIVDPTLPWGGESFSDRSATVNFSAALTGRAINKVAVTAAKVFFIRD